jgi:hypothetical protein
MPGNIIERLECLKSEQRGELMVTMEVLEDVIEKLTEMEKTYGRNYNKGDLERGKACGEAKKALRNIVLHCLIKGAPLDLAPVKKSGIFGWLMIDADYEQKEFLGQ